MNQSLPSRRLTAIMFTDMVGYSMLTQKSEALALNLLAEHSEILRPIFPRHSGIEIKTIGDAFLVEFGSALNAVECAVEIQEALRRRNEKHSEAEPIRIRIGIHIGDVIHSGGDILGDGVNIAARIYPMAQPEGICISEDVAHLVENTLEFPLHKLERQKLKNIERQMDVYSIGLPWLPRQAVWEKTCDLPSAHPTVPKKRKVLWTLSAVFLLALFTGLYFFMLSPRPSGPNSKTIAVLPFTNMNGNTEEDFFSDGITDDILTQLCKIADLNVISRTTMIRYKGSKKSLREIGQELHAGVVLEGSVRRTGSRIRISSQLIDAVNDRHIWAATYDRELRDVFEIQSEIAQKIVATLQAKLSSAEKKRLEKPTVSNTEAYNLLLKGRYFFNRRDRENIAKAIALYKQALFIDSNDARVWASLSAAYITQAGRTYIDTDEGYKKARQAAEKALLLDDQLASGHGAMGWIKRTYEWDWTGADAEYQKALTLEPGNAGTNSGMASLSAALGRFDEAISLTRKAITLDPVSVGSYANLGLWYLHVNRLEEAAGAYRNALELNPQFPVAHAYLGLVYLLQGKADTATLEIQKEAEEIWRLFGLAISLYDGQRAESDAALQELIKKDQTNSAYQIAEIYAHRGSADKAFIWLERAYTQRDGGLATIKGDPFLKNIERDPRYAAFMKKMKLPL
jgi:adenylate cyclase